MDGERDKGGRFGTLLLGLVGLEEAANVGVEISVDEAAKSGGQSAPFCGGAGSIVCFKGDEDFAVDETACLESSLAFAERLSPCKAFTEAD